MAFLGAQPHLREHFGPRWAWKISWKTKHRPYGLQPVLSCSWRNYIGDCCRVSGSRHRLFFDQPVRFVVWRASTCWQFTSNLTFAACGSCRCFGDFVDFLASPKIGHVIVFSGTNWMLRLDFVFFWTCICQYSVYCESWWGFPPLPLCLYIIPNHHSASTQSQTPCKTHYLDLCMLVPKSHLAIFFRQNAFNRVLRNVWQCLAHVHSAHMTPKKTTKSQHGKWWRFSPGTPDETQK